MPPGGLSPAEHLVVELIAHGATRSGVARRLGIAPSTVSNHLYRIGKMLGGNSSQAFIVGEAYRRGWLPVGEPATALVDVPWPVRRNGPTKAEILDATARERVAAAGLVGERTEQEWVDHPHALHDLMRVLAGDGHLWSLENERRKQRAATG